ncbi:hypothetical protein LBMAG53_26740 [Planctomycetota bacterium]|nr:hypothetical protein LBMAG53_26740 [Planctomycetota bacterium]
MATALTTSLTGMLSSQLLLDATANNVANANTPGYRAERVGFADYAYRAWQPALAPSGVVGGSNPDQIGSGVGVATIDRDQRQGAIQATGRSLDLAITGDAFFRLNDPTNLGEVYTRVGDFGFDGGTATDPPRLVELSTGRLVLNDQGTAIDLVDSIPPTASTALTLSGNLARPTGPAGQDSVLTTLFPMQRRDGGTVSQGTLLSALDIFQAGAPTAPVTVNAAGTYPDGTAFSSSLILQPTDTVGDLVAKIDALFDRNAMDPVARASFDAGRVALEGLTPGKHLSLFLGEQPIPAPPTSAALHAWQNGAASDLFDWNRLRLSPQTAVPASFQVFTADGTRHVIDGKAIATDTAADGSTTWDLILNRPPVAEGSLVAGSDVLRGLRFDATGQLTAPPTGSLAIAWATGGTTTVTVDASTLTGFQAGSNLNGTTDGTAAGTLTATTVGPDGQLFATYTNGVVQPMSTTSRLGLARFINPAGLTDLGDNLWSVSANSGIAQDGSASRIAAGAIESSNVNIAEEFSRLITAQRGFQTNARAFQAADSMHEEANGLIR